MASYPTDRESLERDCDITFFIASGPGGQHRNKVTTGVRLHHRPTHSVVTATERRSQAANREMAFERMRQRLQAINTPELPRIATRPTAASKRERRQEKQRRSRIKRLRRTGTTEE